MKKICILLIFSILILTACSETTHNDYLFSGESKHWEAEYTYNGKETWGEKDGQRTYSNEHDFRFILKYKGSLEELSSLQKLEYYYETNSGHGSGTEVFTEPPLSGIFSASGSSIGGGKVHEDAVIKVHVKWDDFEESFELHNNSK
ncbi:hypothetical protein QTL97_11435 [Sporosarcina thermotolerans]|uniref:Lipoprotein n=1 Tax=Sporosarcina thermotolerans TaxID=633404 RepID=A0AAW9AEP7_9BACL|nr:hypothetical protein [Sporosarcina thermotolerans]MDW0117551.1 hypothetical protein [Sporosarcina thermotolerans]